MANGYLGKISAIVTANTGDFKPKLDAAASDVRQFAKSMQSSLGAASRDASRAFDGIYTPLQKIERALKAASDTKIAFKGYAGQIQNIEDLKKRLAELSRRQIDVSVSGTSFSSIAALRKAIDGVTSRHMAAVVNAGGLDRARSVVAYQRAEEGRGAYGPVVAVDTNGLDVAVEKMAMLRSEKDVEVAIRVVDGRLLEDAVTKFKRLTSVSKEIDGPLSAAKERLLGLSMAIQTAVHPALVSLQAADEKLHAAIDKNADISTKAYVRLRKEVEAFNAAVAIGAEADSLASRVGDGRNLKGLFPRQYDALKAAGDATASAGELSGADLKGFGVTRQQAIVDRQASMLATMQAKRATMRGDTSELDASIERTTARLEKETATYLRLIGAAKEYQKSQPTLGNPTGTFGPQAPSGSKVVGGITRVPVDRNEHSLGASSPYYPGQRQGNPTGPFGPDLSEDMKRARSEAESLQRSMDSLRSKANFTISGNVQSVEQAEAEIQRLISLVATLDGKQKAALRGTINSAVDSLKSGDVSTIQTSIGVLRDRMTAAGVKGVKSGDIGRMGMDKFTLAVQQAGFAIDDFFSVTGDFSQRMRAIGNNVTQLGFIIGGATGLFVALGVTVGTQVSLMISKYVFGLEDAKDKQERLATMTGVLNSSFDEQKKVVESLASSYESLGKSIREATLPEANRRAVGRRDTASDVRQEQAASRRELLATTLPEIAELRAKRAKAEKQLTEGGVDFAVQADLRSQIKFTVDRENDLVGRIEEDAATRVKNRDFMLNDRTRDVMNSSVLDQVKERSRQVAEADASGRVANTDAIDIGIRQMSRVAGELAVGLQQIKDAAALAAFEMSGPLTDAIASSQREIESLGEFVNKDTRDAITRAGFELADATKRATEGALSKAAFGREVSRISQNVQNAQEEIAFGGAFKNEMEDRQKSVDAARQEAESSAGRGKQLAMTPGQRAGQELADGLLDIRRRFGEIAEDGSGLIDEAGVAAAQRNLVGERMRQQAPAIFSLADSVENAIMQGPSRSALQASDVTTTQGAAELNRLLRGDDTAKNQDLVELQKQSSALQELVTIARQNGAPPGIFD